MPIRTIFLGSNWESLEILKALHMDNTFEVVAVITQPDRPFGRKKTLTPTAVRGYAEENRIPVMLAQKSAGRYKDALERFSPDLVVCVAFGEIIPGFFLDAPKYKAVNVHFSLLPKYRGAVPIQMAILDGEKKTGISIVQMVEKLDAGPIIATYEEPIKDDDTNHSLRERLVERSAKELPRILKLWVNGDIPLIEQDGKQATFCYQKDISKDKAQIKWDQMEPEYIERMIRAFIPWPVAWTMFEDKILKIYEAELVEKDYLMPGEFKSKDGKLLIGTKVASKQIAPKKLQLEGKKVMEIKDFLAGRNI
jgi:methionyl-tRNA formyltransferase